MRRNLPLTSRAISKRRQDRIAVALIIFSLVAILALFLPYPPATPWGYLIMQSCDTPTARAELMQEATRLRKRLVVQRSDGSPWQCEDASPDYRIDIITGDILTLEFSTRPLLIGVLF